VIQAMKIKLLSRAKRRIRAREKEPSAVRAARLLADKTLARTSADAAPGWTRSGGQMDASTTMSPSGKTTLRVNWRPRSGCTVVLFVMVLFQWFWSSVEATPPAHIRNPNCTQYSPPPNAKYWDAMDRCSLCAQDPRCGYCHSTMRCEFGSPKYPAYGSCPQWYFEPSNCPTSPKCELHVECGHCSSNPNCVWCATDQSCISVEEGFASSCGSLITNSSCPTVVVPRTFRI
jgi:hypothetical protein